MKYYSTFTYNVYNKSIFEENNVDFKEILIANLKRNRKLKTKLI